MPDPTKISGSSALIWSTKPVLIKSKTSCPELQVCIFFPKLSTHSLTFSKWAADPVGVDPDPTIKKNLIQPLKNSIDPLEYKSQFNEILAFYYKLGEYVLKDKFDCRGILNQYVKTGSDIFQNTDPDLESDPDQDNRNRIRNPAFYTSLKMHSQVAEMLFLNAMKQGEITKKNLYKVLPSVQEVVTTIVHE